MKDFVFVKLGQEQEFIDEALLLGFDELVLVYTLSDAKKLNLNLQKKLFSKEIKVSFGVVVEKNISIEGFDYYLANGAKISQLFKCLTHVFNNEVEEEKDFIHQRRSGLNHVVLAECAKKGISVLTGINMMNGKNDSIIIGRMKQNSDLCKKKNVEYSVVSLADNTLFMRHSKDLKSFVEVFF